MAPWALYTGAFLLPRPNIHSQLGLRSPLSRPSHPEPNAGSLGFCQKPLSPGNSRGTAGLPWYTLPDFSLRFLTCPGASVPRKEISEHQAGDTVGLTSLWSCTVDPGRLHGVGGREGGLCVCGGRLQCHVRPSCSTSGVINQPSLPPVEAVITVPFIPAPPAPDLSLAPSAL